MLPNRIGEIDEILDCYAKLYLNTSMSEMTETKIKGLQNRIMRTLMKDDNFEHSSSKIIYKYCKDSKKTNNLIEDDDDIS